MEKTERRGGARPGAGGAAPYSKSQDLKDLDAAKARKEAALADMHELDYKIKTREYVSRVAVQQASATAMATLAQTLRSVPDNLERRGIPPEVCVRIDKAINEALADVGIALAKIHDKPEDNHDDLFYEG